MQERCWTCFLVHRACSISIWFSSIQALSHVWLFATPWTAARQASLSITNSRSLLKLRSVESVMPSNHLILCCTLILLPSIFPSIRVFSNESAFELWCWRRLLRVPWTARRSNRSILKEIIPECSLEGLMLKLKLQYFGHLLQRADSFEKTLMLGKIEGRRRRVQQRMRWLDGITDSMDTSLNNSGTWWLTGRPGVLQSMGLQRVRHDWSRELNWVEANNFLGPHLHGLTIYLKATLK